jgi:hypothetical protein
MTSDAPRQVRRVAAVHGRGHNVPGAVGRRALRGAAADHCEVLLEQWLPQRLGRLRLRRLLLRRPLVLQQRLRRLVLMHTPRLYVCVCRTWTTIVVSCVCVRAIFVSTTVETCYNVPPGMLCPYYTAAHATPHTTLYLDQNGGALRHNMSLYYPGRAARRRAAAQLYDCKTLLLSSRFPN